MPELPERVRARVLALAAQVLPVVTPLPPALRRVAAFAPARRARLGASSIWSALEEDDFRERVATQVSALDLDSDAPTRAALLWLARGDGWQEELEATLGSLTGESSATRGVDSAELDRAREQVASLQRELRDFRAAQRHRLDELKSDNATLRRKLGEARAQLRESEAARQEAEEAMRRAQGAATEAAERAQAEVRRLRARLDEATAGLAAGRKEVREGRDAATLRARYLLDTVLEAAAGLRRELALPAVEGAPGDQVEGRLVAGAEAAGRAAGPVALEQLLAMPRSRLVIDGYNVSKAAWPSSSLEAQRIRLVQALAPLAGRTGAETTVVFDAASSTTRPVTVQPRGVRVVFSPEGVIADDVIRELVAAEPVGRVVVVVTSDQELATDVARAGARVVSSDALVALIET
ncbi:RNA-binding protein [Nocardioides gansuensis]|uniref:RNA-binding protein n=1 Tax=Nocardioides gansuensis TaxID=2138300 RepID=A0A2T8FAI6_9ACTN|nr:NYN domain-containing protein [Nocardioides gansuensis]PVG82738.1 RNA-binding protein [Nocardioides gansuensis]